MFSSNSSSQHYRGRRRGSLESWCKGRQYS